MNIHSTILYTYQIQPIRKSYALSNDKLSLFMVHTYNYYTYLELGQVCLYYIGEYFSPPHPTPAQIVQSLSLNYQLFFATYVHICTYIYFTMYVHSSYECTYVCTLCT